ncbi:Excinuclease ABC subunit B [Metamycoplasma auris 15026]|uniref:UvrABC system protein B n=1 Tax=Metamycoplasma auris 15026 TaxID=1188233 RepID=N9UZC0_9BACT|nr:excinuclease ABC subunit UvrB [Metamycoplasma auris]ENY68537.1 Excinuclease ABC subunit B [Metamycoplasma auris 15026]
MNKFKLVTNFSPSGDQPQAIAKLVEGIAQNKKHQVLLGVTGSGKTFTLANVIAKTNRPALVISHNKTLASQLYLELKELFPHNKVEYFISYFDYYRPEAYKPAEDLYIEKSSITNKEIEAMRISTLNSLITRYDTIVVASVAAIYGAFNPEEYKKHFLKLNVSQEISKKSIKSALVKMHYQNMGAFPEIEQGQFKSVGDMITLVPGYKFDYLIRIEMQDNQIIGIKLLEPITMGIKESLSEIVIYPCTSFLIEQSYVERICDEIEQDLKERIKYFKDNNKLVEAQRLESRITSDIDSIKEFGYTSGMENYARYIDNRLPGQKPYTLFDYLNKDTILYIDESHLMLPQIKGMYEGDKSRKEKLVDYGWRLPSALDNRPLRYDEYSQIDFPRIYLSATPADEEIDLAGGEIITQFIRPTGLLDPVIEIKPKMGQIELIHDLIQNQIKNNERTLILTHTKENAEELSNYLKKYKIKAAYIHEEFEVFERNAILTDLRLGKFDVVIGINLLREGIDLPEVSLILVLDADSSGLGRDKKSLIQIVGRAARNDHGKVIFFADMMSKAMEATIADNKLKREIQQKYNKEHNIIPKTIIKPISKMNLNIASNIKFKKKDKASINKSYIQELIKEMKLAAKNLDFDKAIEIKNYLSDLGWEPSK